MPQTHGPAPPLPPSIPNRSAPRHPPPSISLLSPSSPGASSPTSHWAQPGCREGLLGLQPLLLYRHLHLLQHLHRFCSCHQPWRNTLLAQLSIGATVPLAPPRYTHALYENLYFIISAQKRPTRSNHGGASELQMNIFTCLHKHFHLLRVGLISII